MEKLLEKINSEIKKIEINREEAKELMDDVDIDIALGANSDFDFYEGYINCLYFVKYYIIEEMKNANKRNTN